ncbi:FtsW/RodA/SpoVE family cell cycle protein [Calditrichota bacterium]
MIKVAKAASYFRPSRQGINHSYSEETARLDQLLTYSALALTAVGLIMVYSASTYIAVNNNRADWSIFIRQGLLAIVGLSVFFVAGRLDVSFYRKHIKVALIAICALMAAQLILPIGPIVHGTRRWVSLGFFNLQTSELARCAVIIFLARVLDEKPTLAVKSNKELWKILGIIAIPFLLINLQPDMSSSLVMAAVAGMVLFVGGLGFTNILIIAGTGFVGVSLLLMREAYMRERLWSFIGSVASGEPLNYQTEQSLIAFGNGGWFGMGLGQGKQKMLFLPEPHTDFIFSIIGEEGGMLAAVVIIAAFIVLFMTSIRIAARQPNGFKALLAAGLAGSIMLYALINMGVAVGLLPVTGLPLPFISNGGTSLVVSLWSIGVLRSILYSSG